MRVLREHWFILACFILPLGFFSWFGVCRLIARDEGFYIYAAQLVGAGKVPYSDFFYPQMPLVPYLYGCLMKLVGFSWEAGRIVSVFWTVVTACLLGQYLRSKLGSAWAVVGVALFTTSVLVFTWYTTVQTYGLSACLLFASCIALDRYLNSSASIVWLLTSGFLFGLAIDTRLFFAGLGPLVVLLLLSWRKSPVLVRVRDAALFSLATGFTLLPVLWIASLDFDAFWYNNLGYHLNRSSFTFADAMEKRQRIVQVLTGLTLSPSRKFDSVFQYPILFWLTTIWLLRSVYLRRWPGLPALFALGLWGLNLIPTPTYVQYFAPTVPFMIVLALFGAKDIYDWASRSAAFEKGARTLLVLLLGVYLWHLPSDVERYTRSGVGVIGIGNPVFARDWTVSKMGEVAKKLDFYTAPGEQVIAFWPGFFIGSKAEIYPGLENHFGIAASRKLGSDQRRRYKLLAKDEILALVRAGAVDIVVSNDIPPRRGLRKALEEGGYESIDRVVRTRFYTR